mmetsp:Transcript_39710/g.60856  ORF Transcript_39710/g.60856 Transcript_39710/m.60856 type:complete len:121 (+) Transcript_39710:931-1293(+)
MKQELGQSERSKVNLEGTAGAENPKYMMFWTNEQLLNMFAQELADDKEILGQLTPLGPSASIIFEFTEPTEGVLDVQMFVNDQKVKMRNCGGKDKCDAMEFAASLGASVEFANMAKACSA